MKTGLTLTTSAVKWKNDIQRKLLLIDGDEMAYKGKKVSSRKEDSCNEVEN